MNREQVGNYGDQSGDNGANKVDENVRQEMIKISRVIL
jgi:hypothetical protein